MKTPMTNKSLEHLAHNIAHEIHVEDVVSYNELMIASKLDRENLWRDDLVEFSKRVHYLVDNPLDIVI